MTNAAVRHSYVCSALRDPNHNLNPDLLNWKLTHRLLFVEY